MALGDMTFSFDFVFHGSVCSLCTWVYVFEYVWAHVCAVRGGLEVDLLRLLHVVLTFTH